MIVGMKGSNVESIVYSVIILRRSFISRPSGSQVLQNTNPLWSPLKEKAYLLPGGGPQEDCISFSPLI
jgi:hypothetical protein